MDGSNKSQSYNNSTKNDCCDGLGWFDVVTCVIIAVGIPLTLVAIYALFSLVQKDHVAPIYVINLLISDLIKLCSMIGLVVKLDISLAIYVYGLIASVCFMVCIALERYLIVAWPLWYRHRRTIKVSLLVCALIWAFPLVWLAIFRTINHTSMTAFGVFLLLPFPLLIFFLVGTIKALSAAISVRAEEKHRIVGLLVLVLLIYMLLFLPGIIFNLVRRARSMKLFLGQSISLMLNALADSFLYIFLRKGAVNKVLTCLCCCRKDTSQQSSSMNDNMHTVTAIDRERKEETTE